MNNFAVCMFSPTKGSLIRKDAEIGMHLGLDFGHEPEQISMLGAFETSETVQTSTTYTASSINTLIVSASLPRQHLLGLARFCSCSPGTALTRFCLRRQVLLPRFCLLHRWPFVSLQGFHRIGHIVLVRTIAAKDTAPPLTAQQQISVTS